MQVPSSVEVFQLPGEYSGKHGPEFYQPWMDEESVTPYLSELDTKWTVNDLRCLCSMLKVNLYAFKGINGGMNIYAMACFLSQHGQPNELLSAVRSLSTSEFAKYSQFNPPEFSLPRLTLSSSPYEPLWRHVLYFCFKH